MQAVLPEILAVLLAVADESDQAAAKPEIQ